MNSAAGNVTANPMDAADTNPVTRRITKNISEGKLQVHELTAPEQTEIAESMLDYSARLSEPDCSCLYLAMKTGSTLLTCEKRLTETARANNVPVHGSLWILDQLIESGVITKRIAHQKLSLLMDFNPRLPQFECMKRLKSWMK